MSSARFRFIPGPTRGLTARLAAATITAIALLTATTTAATATASAATATSTATVAAATAAVGPVPAEQTPAGSVAVSRGCYVNTAQALAQISVSGRGWEAGATIELTDKLGRVSATTTADSGGNFNAEVPAPVVDSAQSPQISDAISATYESSPGLPGSTGASAASPSFLTTDYEVRETTQRTGPEPRATYELSGFTPGRTVYAHYLTATGKALTSVSFGTPTGACGLRTVVAAQDPGGQLKRGSYIVQFDNARSYRKLTRPAYRLSVHITRA